MLFQINCSPKQNPQISEGKKKKTKKAPVSLRCFQRPYYTRRVHLIVISSQHSKNKLEDLNIIETKIRCCDEITEQFLQRSKPRWGPFRLVGRSSNLHSAKSVKVVVVKLGTKASSDKSNQVSP